MRKLNKLLMVGALVMGGNALADSYTCPNMIVCDNTSPTSCHALNSNQFQMYWGLRFQHPVTPGKHMFIGANATTYANNSEQGIYCTYYSDTVDELQFVPTQQAYIYSGAGWFQTSVNTYVCPAGNWSDCKMSNAPTH